MDSHGVHPADSLTPAQNRQLRDKERILYHQVYYVMLNDETQNVSAMASRRGDRFKQVIITTTSKNKYKAMQT
jgi:uncharacterized protein YabE (DUF348 family)